MNAITQGRNKPFLEQKQESKRSKYSSISLRFRSRLPRKCGPSFPPWLLPLYRSHLIKHWIILPALWLIFDINALWYYRASKGACTGSDSLALLSVEVDSGEGRLPCMAEAGAGFIGRVAAFASLSWTAAPTRQGTSKAVRKELTVKENERY